MARSYGQFCPVAKAAEIFCERWNALLLREFGAGSVRFSQLQRGVPLMSPSMLSRRLKELEREGIIERSGEGKNDRSYRLTPAGHEFVPVVHALGVWGQRWTRRTLRDDEIDYRLLLWDMERSVRGDAFDGGRTILQLDFTDLPENRATWWFINETERAQLCLEDPGFEPDIYLSVSVPDMIHVWRGDVTLKAALDDERLDVHGPRHLTQRLEDWLNLSPLAAVGPARLDVG